MDHSPKPIRFRSLQIAFSAFCGLMCILLIVLWVRSYWSADQVYGHVSAKKLLHFGSMCG